MINDIIIFEIALIFQLGLGNNVQDEKTNAIPEYHKTNTSVFKKWGVTLEQVWVVDIVVRV